MTAHVVRTHANPIQIAGVGFFSLVLSGLQHPSGIDETRVLVGTQTAHETFSRSVSLCARHVVTAIVSNGELAKDQDRHNER